MRNIFGITFEEEPSGSVDSMPTIHAHELAIAVSLVATLGGCGVLGSIGEPDSFTVDGSITVPTAFPVAPDGKMVATSSELLVDGGTCSSDSGFDDIRDGAEVKVADEAGKIIGLARLESGEQVLSGREMTWHDWVVYDPSICEYRFQIEVEASADFYSLAIGNGSRGALTYTQEELQRGITLSLGG